MEPDINTSKLEKIACITENFTALIKVDKDAVKTIKKLKITNKLTDFSPIFKIILFNFYPVSNLFIPLSPISFL